MLSLYVPVECCQVADTDTRKKLQRNLEIHRSICGGLGLDLENEVTSSHFSETRW
jgi:hypothetical protein